jgi:hypothetical protein
MANLPYRTHAGRWRLPMENLQINTIPVQNFIKKIRVENKVAYRHRTSDL